MLSDKLTPEENVKIVNMLAKVREWEISVQEAYNVVIGLVDSRPSTGVARKCPRCGSERVANKILVCTNSDCAGSHI